MIKLLVNNRLLSAFICAEVEEEETVVTSAPFTNLLSRKYFATRVELPINPSFKLLSFARSSELDIPSVRSK